MILDVFLFTQPKIFIPDLEAYLFRSQIRFEKAKYIYERGTDRSKVVAGIKNKYEWVDTGSSFEMTELSATQFFCLN